jgi:hypothetical protein
MSILHTLNDWLFQSELANIIQVASGGMAVYALRKFNCHTRWCWRIGKHPVEGTTFRTCSKHTTAEHHTELKRRHAIERPEQHALLSEGADDAAQASSH